MKALHITKLSISIEFSTNQKNGRASAHEEQKQQPKMLLIDSDPLACSNVFDVCGSDHHFETN